MKMTAKKLKPQITDYKSPIIPTWCPGCGNYTINAMLMQALVELSISPHKVVLVYDIGCNGNGADKIRAYTVKTLHGRPIPVAIGIKLARPNLPVIVIGGDGGLLWEGIAHLITAAQRNEDITVLIWDNQIYGLTTGQTAPTTQKGYHTPTYPEGTPFAPLNPIALMLGTNASFIARTYTGNPVHVKDTIKAAISYSKPGFRIVDILQNCATYNPTTGYYSQRARYIENIPTTKENALKLANDSKYTYMGVFWQA